MALEDTIESVASEPVDVSADNVRVRQRSIRELIEADRYLEAQNDIARTGFPFKRFLAVPPGAQ